MSNISVVIITKDEEKRIKACLDSLRSFANEIVIIDDFSTDKTVEVCKSYGAKVIMNKSDGNFDRQRNIGIDNATCEWIIQMDADEIIPEETARKITATIKDPDSYVAFQIRRRNFFFGQPLKYGGAADTYGTKIFKKGLARYTGKSVHETLKVDGPIGTIDAEVHHYSYFSIAETLAKMNFYTDVVAERFVEENKNISFWYIKYRIIWKSFRFFWKLYIRKKGYKDGMYGFIWCILNILGPQIMWLKVWEKALKNNKLK
jgi:glycosyltransferase involved in cell wall biosynthesis